MTRQDVKFLLMSDSIEELFGMVEGIYIFSNSINDDEYTAVSGLYHDYKQGYICGEEFIFHVKEVFDYEE